MNDPKPAVAAPLVECRICAGRGYYADSTGRHDCPCTRRAVAADPQGLRERLLIDCRLLETSHLDPATEYVSMSADYLWGLAKRIRAALTAPPAPVVEAAPEVVRKPEAWRVEGLLTSGEWVVDGLFRIASDAQLQAERWSKGFSRVVPLFSDPPLAQPSPASLGVRETAKLIAIEASKFRPPTREWLEQVIGRVVQPREMERLREECAGWSRLASRFMADAEKAGVVYDPPDFARIGRELAERAATQEDANGK